MINAQVTGLWKTIGDRDGTEKSIVEIYEKEGKIYGKVVKLLPAAAHTTCERCPGEMKDRPITGMVVLKDLKKTPKGANDGKAIDPSSGKTYNCFIELENPDKLKLRGYIGVPTVGRTQYWYRVK
jgi:uncharacterized protein (DUF2147 family)